MSELGGTITLESKEGSFTKFLITLPVKKELVFDQSHLNWLKGKGVNFKKIRRLQCSCNQAFDREKRHMSEIALGAGAGEVASSVNDSGRV